MKLQRGFLSALLVCFYASDTHAHSFNADGTHAGEPPSREAAPQQPNDVLQGLIDSAKVWEVEEDLTLCFMDGAIDTQEFFLQVVKDWENAAPGLTIDGTVNGAPRNCADEVTELRISFNQEGNWSYVGTDAEKIPAKEATLNIGTLTGPLTNRLRKRTRGSILHEFGHALGLKHEHQHPDSNCEAQLDWPTVYSAFEAFEVPWNKQKVDANIRPIIAKEIELTPYDRSSVMHYALPAKWFLQKTQATCYVEKANILSDGDKAIAAERYPATLEEQKEYFDRLIGNAATVAGSDKFNRKDRELFVEEFNAALPQSIINVSGNVSMSQSGGINVQGNVTDSAIIENFNGGALNLNGGAVSAND